MPFRRPFLFLVLTIFAVSSTQTGWAAAGAEEGFAYPELSVTPRASERLEREAGREQSTAWTNLLPFYISGASTLVAGLVQKSNYSLSKDPDGKSGLAGMAVGGAWLVGTAALAAMYRPYVSGAAEISGMSKKTDRDQLFRERISEEDMDAPARLVRRLAWISALSNLGAGVYMAANAESGSAAIPADIVAVAGALIPLVFQSHWSQVACDQHEYKKRIYAPVATATFYSSPGTQQLAPGMNLTLFF